MIGLDFSAVTLKLRHDNGKAQVFDPVRKKWLALTPEEHVRQHLLAFFINVLHYPATLIAVEKKILTGTMSRRFDIVVYDRSHQPWMLVECKAPGIPITEKALHQLLQYHSSVQCAYWVLSNGHQTYCADACDTGNIKWIEQLPPYKS